ncbi:MAG TPA: fatty acid hydroxylase, partial [Spongiibacteraceae bacterium]|nr:fatty acid hydroxylase [Spongiibacteraceae bacterium]
MNTPSKEQTALPTTAGAALRAMYSHPSPVILSALAVFFVGLRIWMGNWQWQDIIAPLIILLAWPFWEWAIHVFLLHFKPT